MPSAWRRRATRDDVADRRHRPGAAGALDAACGAGEVGLALAALGRSVTLVDLAAPMLDAARERAAALGLRDVGFVHADLLALPLADGAVDAAVCRWGYMLASDPLARVFEMRGASSRPAASSPSRSGTSASATRRSRSSTTCSSSGVTPPPDVSVPGPFALADRAELHRLVERAGYALEAIDEVGFALRFADVADFWRTMLDISASTREALAGLAAGEHEAVRAEAGRRASRFLTDDGLALPASSLCVAARVPDDLGADGALRLRVRGGLGRDARAPRRQGHRPGRDDRLGVPVPDGFTVTDDGLAAAELRGGEWPRRAGGARSTPPSPRSRPASASASVTPRTPLLVSVRSGAAFSMPGMMDRSSTSA